ncbi:PTS alpha-glucoside transporter subunit IIBC [Patescibacteria group bacterium]|nr:PTS alpha-glucoside transporter subunit IIBC [Patescibacteria group bacterium]MCG2700247.1 PTS alpha-glucoside transporter subunit IIBC [Candidatus Parcubacteria bacterium]
MDIIIVCHTEFGFVDNKKIIFDKKAFQGVEDGVVSLIKLAKKYGAKITFVVCPEVVDFFPKNTDQEIGLHIHPGWEEFKKNQFKWYVGDQYLKERCRQSLFSSALQDHPYSEQFDMIKAGKEHLKESLDIEPKVFVAGRGSLNSDTIRALIKNGFTHDCSAIANKKLPYFDWSKLPRICMPYHPNSEDYQKKGDLPILIVPASQTIFRRPIAPEGVSSYGISWFKVCFSEYYRQNVPLFHIFTHSPAMTDPYYFSVMDNFLSFISKHNDINFKFTSEIKEYPINNFKTDILSYLFTPNKEIVKTIFRKLLS